METVLYLNDSKQIKASAKAEFIIEPSALSRFGKLSLHEVNSLAKEAKAEGHKVFLEWDILMVESDFKKAVDLISNIELSNLDAIRVQDPGAIHWCLENTELDLHLNLETGNHNLVGINSWLDLCKERATRLILSIEWSRKQLEELIPKLSCPIEFLGLGRILLFYTPRYLLKAGLTERESTMEMGNASHWIEASGQSEESPHKGFPLLENQHGTFMFLPSDHCLLDHMSELKELGINYLRIDNRFMEEDFFKSALNQLENPSEENFNELKALSKSRLIRGFFNTNKSDVLFKKLKNHRIQRKDENYLGQVLDVNKKNYLAIKLKNPKKKLLVGEQLSLLTPDGKTKQLKVNWLKDSSGKELESATGDDLIFVNHVGGVSVRAAVYFANE